MQGLEILDLVPLVGTGKLQSIAELYQDIFREPPWKEELSISRVLATMEEQFTKPFIVALGAFWREAAIGFAWAYEFFETDLKEGTRFSPALEPYFLQGRIFYLQEIGVLKALRKQGVGEELGRMVLRVGKEKGAGMFILSTNGKAIGATHLFRKMGFVDSGIVRPPAELGRTYWVLEL